MQVKGERRMKLERFDFIRRSDFICLLPSIDIVKDDKGYEPHNLQIVIHLWIWHWRWLWVEKEQE